LTKNGCATLWATFSKNSSGHPAADPDAPSRDDLCATPALKNVFVGFAEPDVAL
jgi:hypothetical protein